MHYARVMVSLKGDVYVLEAEANSAVLEEHYRNYVLRSHLEKGLCIGEVFRSGVRVAYCESIGLVSSLQHLRSIVDGVIQQRVEEAANSRPKPEDLNRAIRTLHEDWLPAQRALLHAHLIKDNAPIDIVELARLARCQCTTQVHLLYAELARSLCDELTYDPDLPKDGRDRFIAVILAPQGDCHAGDNVITLRLEDDVFSALRLNQKIISNGYRTTEDLS